MTFDIKRSLCAQLKEFNILLGKKEKCSKISQAWQQLGLFY